MGGWVGDSEGWGLGKSKRLIESREVMCVWSRMVIRS